MPQGQGYRFNPAEENLLQNVLQYGNPDIAGQLLPLVLGTVEGAQARRSENVAQREAGMAGLQELAMSLASQAADEDAVRAAVLGQAQGLPGMGRQGALDELAGLSDFVGGLYRETVPTSSLSPEGIYHPIGGHHSIENVLPGSEITYTSQQMPVSGLAPPELRQAIGLSEEDRMQMGLTMSELVGQGMPMDQVMLQIQRSIVGSGMDPTSASQAIAEAQSMYGQMVGMDTAGIEGLIGQVEEYQQEHDLGDVFSQLLEDRAIKELPFPGTEGNDVPVDELVAMLANQPGALEALAAELQAEPESSGVSGAIEDVYNFTQDYNVSNLFGLLG